MYPCSFVASTHANIFAANNIETGLANVGNEYGVEFAPLRSDEEVSKTSIAPSRRTNIFQMRDTWIAGWRTASSPEQKRFWLSFVETASLALNSDLLLVEEWASIYHEILFIDFHGQQALEEWDRAAVEAVKSRSDWQWQLVVGCSCVLCAGCSCASRIEANVALPTPETTLDNSPERNLTPLAVSSPEEQPKKRRGRPPGQKDLVPRARRGTLKHLAPKDRSRRSRETGQVRRALEQQQQTPPS